MKILVIGGNRFLGVELTAQLLARGHDVTLLNRGSLEDPFGPRVKRIHVDRGTDAFDAALIDTTWDAVVDFALFDGAQARRLMRVLGGRIGHLIMISTGQVYLVRTPRPALAVEADYAGAVMPSPPSPAEEEDWRYGIDKRAAEDAIASAPFTTFRIPMVHGGRDHKKRIDGLLWQLIDRQPIALRDPHRPLRHVFSGAVTRAILNAIDRGPAGAFNLAWPEPISASAFVEAVGHTFGVEPMITVDPNAGGFLNSAWMSSLDSTRARQQLGFSHEALEEWLPQVVHATVSRLSR